VKSLHIVNVGYDPTNLYFIIPETGSGLLVDCSWPRTVGKLDASLKRNGLSFKQIAYLLVTHFHPDHAGLTQELRDRGVTLLLFETQAPYAEALSSIMKPDSGYVRIVVEGTPLHKHEDSRRLLLEAGIPGEVLLTPGHSEDSISLVLDNGMAFTGDLPPLFQLMATDITARASWHKITSLGANRIYPAHGNPYQI
jgi:endoribonuclease LACTB2